MTNSYYSAWCRICKLSAYDLEQMSVGMALDHIDKYMDIKHPPKENEKIVEYAEDVPWL